MGREYFDAMDKVCATGDWKARTLAALEEEPTARPRRRPTAQGVLVAAAVCAALLATAVAVSPGLREALADTLGSFAPYSAPVTGVSATDQGIEIRAVSAISDGSVVRVFLEVQDKTGDRLDGATELDVGRMHRPEAQYAATGYGAGACLSYDAKTHTALFPLDFRGRGAPASGGYMEVEVEGLQPGVQRGILQFPKLELSAAALPARTLATGEVVLEPGQTAMALEGTDLVSLSSCGFGPDGMLHIQFRVPEGTNWEDLWLDPFIDSKSDEQERLTRYNSSRTGFLTTHFEEGGKSYWDVRYPATPADLDDLAIREAMDYAVTTHEPIEGEWKLAIPLEDVPFRQIAADQKVGSVVVKSIRLSTLGIATESDPEGGPETLVYPAAVFLADGSTVSAGGSDGAFHTNSYTANHWTFDEPVDPEQVVGVAFGYWYIPLQGDQAGPGRWLAELPE